MSPSGERATSVIRRFVQQSHLFPYIAIEVHFARKFQEGLIQLGLSAAECLYKLLSTPTLNDGLRRRFQSNRGADQVDDACTFHLLCQLTDEHRQGFFQLQGYCCQLRVSPRQELELCSNGLKTQ